MTGLKGKVVLITGGSRGIGAACVKMFAEANAKVAFTYVKNKNAAVKLISEINKPNEINAYKVNLENEEEIQSTINQILNDFGKIDILVNNAGIWNYGEVENMSLSHWEETLNINLTGSFLFTKAVVPIMKKNKFGRIINVTSTAGQRGEAFHSHYAASKGALISFTKSLAVELAGYNITVNSVAPGWVDTDMCVCVFEDESYKEKVRMEIPVSRIATTEDIAGPIFFLATDLARHINGEIINVNGGSVLCG